MEKKYFALSLGLSMGLGMSIVGLMVAANSIASASSHSDWAVPVLVAGVVTILVTALSWGFLDPKRVAAIADGTPAPRESHVDEDKQRRGDSRREPARTAALQAPAGQSIARDVSGRTGPVTLSAQVFRAVKRKSNKGAARRQREREENVMRFVRFGQAAARRWMWLGAVFLGLFLVGIGTFFITEGFAAKDIIRDALAEEEVVTSSDAAIPDAPVLSAATAESQADVIKAHTLGQLGPYTSMDREDPNRDVYLKGLTLRNSLNLAVMGFKVSDLVIGVGAIFLLLGVADLVLVTPLLYYFEREPARRKVAAPVAAGQPAHTRA